MGQTTTYRSAFSRGLAVVTIGLCVLVLVTVLVVDGPQEALRYAAPLALVTLLVWLAYWRAQVEVSDGGIEVRNVWRTVHVPWPALQDVDGRLGLRLVTAYGAFQAWSVPAPRRTRGNREVPTSEAALIVRARWEELRAAGYLDDPRLERPRAQVTRHTAALAGALALLALSVVVFVAG